jgi:tetratricopeptide (TPR) repeat protein
MSSFLAEKMLEASGVKPQHTNSSIDATVGRLRQKYQSMKPSLRSTSSTVYSKPENTQQLTQEEIAGYERLNRVKICPICQGQGTIRQQFHHYSVDCDCDHCGGEGYYHEDSAATKILKATDLKNQAIQLFKERKYEKADLLFERGIAEIVAFRVGAEAMSLRVALILNRAACALKLKNWNNCIEFCNLALKRDEKNVKALWRLSVAFENLNDVEKAIESLERMLEREPTHTRGLESLERLKLVLAATKEKEEEKVDNDVDDKSNVTEVDSID